MQDTSALNTLIKLAALPSSQAARPVQTAQGRSRVYGNKKPAWAKNKAVTDLLKRQLREQGWAQTPDGNYMQRVQRPDGSYTAKHYTADEWQKMHPADRFTGQPRRATPEELQQIRQGKMVRGITLTPDEQTEYDINDMYRNPVYNPEGKHFGYYYGTEPATRGEAMKDEWGKPTGEYHVRGGVGSVTPNSISATGNWEVGSNMDVAYDPGMGPRDYLLKAKTKAPTDTAKKYPVVTETGRRVMVDRATYEALARGNSGRRAGRRYR